MSIRDTILAAEDIGTDVVPVPAWKVTVQVRGLTLGERNDALTAARDPETNVLNLSEYYARIIIATVADPETGEQVFTEDDVAALLGKSSAPADLLAKKALTLSGMDETGDVPKAVDAAGEASSETATNDSSSQ